MQEPVLPSPNRILKSVVLPRRVVPQPVPFLDARNAGDCGACVLSGLLDLPIPEIYARYLPDRTGFTVHSMRLALHNAEHDKGLDRIITDTPIWPFMPAIVNEWGLPGFYMSLPWWQYVQMALEAGYYGLASVNFHKLGAPYPADHWVLLCGARQQLVPVPGTHGGAKYENEVLVSCSATSSPDEEWVSVHDFLRQRGGFHLYLARPTKP